MSYSLVASGATKAEAKEDVIAQMKTVVEGQSVHAVDADEALAAAHAFIDLVRDPKDGEKVHVSLSGSLSWRGDGEEREFTGSSVNVGVHVAPAP